MLTFARGRAGIGLFLQREATAFLIFMTLRQPFLDHGAGFLSFLLAVLALFIVLGLLTSVCSGLAALLTVALSFVSRDLPLDVVAATVSICLSLAMLGAGGYSLDALLFGRRRIILPKS